MRTSFLRTFVLAAVMAGPVSLAFARGPAENVSPRRHPNIAAAQQLALQALANLRQQQASSLAYFDVFWVLAVVMVALAFVVVLMKRSVAEKGARIGGE